MLFQAQFYYIVRCKKATFMLIMLLKSAIMLAAFLECIITVAQSQLSDGSSFSSSQAASYSGTGSSYTSNSGFASSSSGFQSSAPASSNAQLQPIFPPLPDPTVEVFAHSLIHLLQTSKLFQNVIPFTLDDPYNDFLKDGIKILQTDGAIDPEVAKFVADAAESVSSLTSDLYFSAISHMIGKILSYNGVLTQDTALSYPKTILGFVEDYGRKNGISDNISVIRSVSNGINNFLASLGLATSGVAVLAFKIFVEELKALASGSEI